MSDQPYARLLPDNTQHSQQTSMSPVGFEPTISAGERPQTYALSGTATWTGVSRCGVEEFLSNFDNIIPKTHF